MKTALEERLRAYLKHRNMPIREFEKSIGAANGYVGGLGESIHGEKLIRISSIYPDLNINWVLYGEGEMLKDPNLQSGDVNGQNVINNSSTGNVRQVASGNEAKLLQEISTLKDKLMKMQQMVIRACMAKDQDEKNEIMKEIINL